MDVLHDEPMREPVPLLQRPNVLLTPHVAASTAQGLHRMGLASAENTIAFFEGRLDVEAMINPESLRRG